MSIAELEKTLKGLRCSGMAATLRARALQVASGEYEFLKAMSRLVQDELDRRKTNLIDRRFTQSKFETSAAIREVEVYFFRDSQSRRSEGIPKQ